ncbi:MAG: hemerythrin domain-containing protein [Rhodospirillaceae bacterium]|nr:hemerythrin domain-containing protein [Rhodospirillaceae bacterium]
MKLTDALLGEHGVIYELFAYVRDTAANSDDVQQIQGAVEVFERLLLSHARIEEELLFPRLDPHLGEMGPLAVMREEHRQIEDLLTAAKLRSDTGALRSVIGQLLDLAHDHFQKEEGVLFAMAGQFLDAADLTELGNDWAARRKVMLTG